MKINDILGHKYLTNSFLKMFFNLDYFKHNDYTKVLAHRTKDTVDTIKLKKSKSRLKPTDSLLLFHNYINELSMKKFGINVRSDVIFAYGKDFHPDDWRNFKEGEHIIIPSGDYEIYINNNVHDLTVDYGLTADEIPLYIRHEIIKTVKTKSALRDYIFNSIQEKIPDFDENFIYRTGNEFINNLNIKFFSHPSIRALLNQSKKSKTKKDFVHLFNSIINNYISFIKKELPKQKYEIGMEEMLIPACPENILNETYNLIKDIPENYIDEILNQLDVYVDNIKSEKTINTTIDSELMIHCGKFYIIDLRVYSEMCKTYFNLKG